MPNNTKIRKKRGGVKLKGRRICIKPHILTRKEIDEIRIKAYKYVI